MLYVSTGYTFSYLQPNVSSINMWNDSSRKCRHIHNEKLNLILKFNLTKILVKRTAIYKVLKYHDFIWYSVVLLIGIWQAVRVYLVWFW